MSEFNLWISLLTIICVLGAVQGFVAYLILVERKVCAYMQDRVGPNRVGPFGLLQPIADGLKFVLKEDIIPEYVDKLLYLLAPAVAVGMALFAFAVVPFGSTPVAGLSRSGEFSFVIAPNVDIGIVFIFAVSSLNVYGVILGGWASNSKYSFLGSLRASAQLISYEIPMGTSILGIVLLTGSLNLEQIIGHQVTDGIWGWNIWYQPLAFLLFLTSVFAECNRLPFDLAECEQELVGGFHTEYSALKFGLFFLGEYTHMITTSFLLVILFFGGWHIPGVADAGGGVGAMILKLIVLFVKMFCFILFYMVVRWSIPRFKFDQLMALAWKVMIPLAFMNLFAVLIVKELNANIWWLLPISFIMLVGTAMIASYWPRGPARVLVVTRGHERVETAIV